MNNKIVLFILLLSLISINGCKNNTKFPNIANLNVREKISFEDLNNLKKLEYSHIDNLNAFVSDSIRSANDILILTDDNPGSDSPNARGTIIRWNIKEKKILAKSKPIEQPRYGFYVIDDYVVYTTKHAACILDTFTLKKDFGEVSGYAPYYLIDLINSHLYIVDKVLKTHSQSLHLIDLKNKKNNWQYPAKEIAYSANIAYLPLIIEKSGKTLTFVIDSNNQKLKLLTINSKTGELIETQILSDLTDAEGFLHYPDNSFFKGNNSKNIIKFDNKIIISFRNNEGIKIVCFELDLSCKLKILWSKEYKEALKISENDPQIMNEGISIDSNFLIIDDKLIYILSKFKTVDYKVIFDNTLITCDVNTGKEIDKIKLESDLMCNWIKRVESNNSSCVLCNFIRYNHEIDEEYNSLALISLNPLKVEWSKNFELGVRSQIKVNNNLIWMMNNDKKRVYTIDLSNGKGLSFFDIPSSSIKKIKTPAGGEEELPDFVDSNNFIFPINENKAFLLAFDGRIYELEER